MKILVIADAHGNFEALQTVLASGADYDEIFHVGDTVGYGPEPLECISTLKDCLHVRGNHDEAVAYNSVSHPSVSGHYKEFSLKTVAAVRALVTEREFEWLKSLPLTHQCERAGKSFFLVHGTPRSPLYEYFNPQTADSEVWSILQRLEADFVIMGHTHKPFIRELGRKTILNPGSLGQPRDGDWRTGFAVVDTENSHVEFRRLEYDVEPVCRKLEERGFPSYLQYALRVGYTPKVDNDGNVLEGSLSYDGLKVG